MDALGTIKWPGISGRSYTYWIYPIGTQFNSAPINYVFAKETEPNMYEAIYVGETSDASERSSDHHKMPCIKRHGATHIHVHRGSDDADTRRAEESDIIARWDPPCNG